MNNRISAIKNNVQDRYSMAWKRLCEYIDKIAATEAKDFNPREAIGKDLYFQIHILPESIAELKR